MWLSAAVAVLCLLAVLFAWADSRRIVKERAVPPPLYVDERPAPAVADPPALRLPDWLEEPEPADVQRNIEEGAT